MLSKMESAIKEGQGEKAKDIYQVPLNWYQQQYIQSTSKPKNLSF